MSYKTKIGNLLEESNLDATIITTNGFIKTNGECVLGAGIAKSIKEIFPSIPKILGSKIKKDGNIVNTIGLHNGSKLLSFPVKPAYTTPDNVVKHMKGKVSNPSPGWASLGSPDLIEQSLIQLVSLVNENKWTNVGLPLLGCGAGELSWVKDVEPLVNKYLDSRFTVMSFKESDFEGLYRKEVVKIKEVVKSIKVKNV